MKIQLSNSAINTYIDCPYKWHLHYQKKIRSLNISSPLFFGSAIDDALNGLLLTKKKDLTPDEKKIVKQDVFEVFTEKMTNIDINREMVNICKSPRVDYYKSDYDFGLLEDEDRNTILNFAKELGFDIKEDTIDEFMNECFGVRKAKQRIGKDEQKLYNYITWLSLRRKGIMLIQAYKDVLLPEIDEVISIQEKISLPDEDGNILIGYIDFVARMKDGHIYVLDNKTSSQKYKDDSVITSQQLSFYSEYKENRKCGYIVVNKKLKKREPRVNTQIVLDTIPEEMIDQAFSTASEVLEGIKEESFTKNEKNCFMYGRKCQFFNYCRTDGNDISGLICLRN